MVIIKYTARELNAWSKLDHPNILKLHGLAIFRSCLAMVSPWMAYGNVNSVLKYRPNLDRYAMVSMEGDRSGETTC
jgi:son of sevenless-like protein